MVPAGGRPWRAKTTWRYEQAGGAWGPGGGAWRARRSAPRGRVRSRSVSSKAAGHVVCRCPELGSTPASVCICVRTVRRACLCRCTAAPSSGAGASQAPQWMPETVGSAKRCVRSGLRFTCESGTEREEQRRPVTTRCPVTSYVVWPPAARQRMVLCVRHGRTGQRGAQSRGASRCSEEPTI